MAEEKETKTKKKPTAKAASESKAEKAKPAAKPKKASAAAKPAATKQTAPKAAKAKPASRPKAVESKPKADSTKAPVAEQAPKKAAVKTKAEPFVSKPLPRLQDAYRGQVSSDLTKEFSYTSPMQVPTVKKIVVNIGLGEALTNAKAVESATGDITAITGQKPVVTKARKSIAGFKIREGQAIGVSVTLRGRRMWEFLDRLISSALPRLRDFRGIPRNAFDGRGNYSLGLREQIIFPEIDYNAIDKIRGLQIIIVTSAGSDREGMRLLELLGMPFAQIETGAA